MTQEAIAHLVERVTKSMVKGHRILESNTQNIISEITEALEIINKGEHPKMDARDVEVYICGWVNGMANTINPSSKFNREFLRG